DRKSTRLNSSHVSSSYAVFCLKKKNRLERPRHRSHRGILQMRRRSSQAFPNRTLTMQTCSTHLRRPMQEPEEGKSHSRRKAVRSSCRKISVDSEKKQTAHC